MKIKPGTTDVTTYVKLVDPTSGDEETGLTISDLDMVYIRDLASAVKADAVALATTSDAHADNKMFEIDGTNAKGVYRADWPDAAFAAGVARVQLIISGAAIDTAMDEIELDTSLVTISDIYSDTAAMPDAIWNEAVAGNSDAGSFGQMLSDIYSDTTVTETFASDIYSDLTKSPLSNLSSTVVSTIAPNVVQILSDVSDILSDLTKTKLSDILTDTAAISNIIPGVWDAKQSDYVDTGSMGKALSDIVTDTAAISNIIPGVWDEAQADHSDAGSFGKMVSDIYSDTTALAAGGSDWSGADRSTILSDLLAIETAAAKYTSDVTADPLSTIHSETTEILGDTATLSTLASDIAEIDQDSSDIKGAMPASDVAGQVWGAKASDYTTAGTFGEALSDATISLSNIYSNTENTDSFVESNIASDTAVIEAALSDVQSDTNKIVSDLVKTPLSTIQSDTAVIEAVVSDVQSDTNKLVSDVTANPLSTIYSGISAISGSSDWSGAEKATILSDLARLESDHVKTPLSNIYSDTTAFAGGALDWSGAENATILSDLAAIESELAVTHSETTAIQGGQITITPLSATVSAGAVSTNNLTAYQHAALGPYVWTITDSDGNAVSQAGDTVKLSVYAPTDQDTELWTVTGAVSGASSNIVTVSEDDTNTGSAGVFSYRLVNTTDDVELNRGSLTIEPGPDVT